MEEKKFQAKAIQDDAQSKLQDPLNLQIMEAREIFQSGLFGQIEAYELEESEMTYSPEFKTYLLDQIITTWSYFCDMEIQLRQFKQATKVFESAVSCPVASQKGLLWIKYAEFCTSRNKLSNARKVYVRAIEHLDNHELQTIVSKLPEDLIPQLPAEVQPTKQDVVTKEKSIATPEAALAQEHQEESPMVGETVTTDASVQPPKVDELAYFKSMADVIAPLKDELDQNQFYSTLPEALPAVMTSAPYHLLFDPLPKEANAEKDLSTEILEQLSLSLKDKSVFENIRAQRSAQEKFSQKMLFQYQALLADQFQQGSQLYLCHASAGSIDDDNAKAQRLDYAQKCHDAQHLFIKKAQVSRIEFLQQQQQTLATYGIAKMKLSTEMADIVLQRTILHVIHEIDQLENPNAAVPARPYANVNYTNPSTLTPRSSTGSSLPPQRRHSSSSSRPGSSSSSNYQARRSSRRSPSPPYRRRQGRSRSRSPPRKLYPSEIRKLERRNQGQGVEYDPPAPGQYRDPSPVSRTSSSYHQSTARSGYHTGAPEPPLPRRHHTSSSGYSHPPEYHSSDTRQGLLPPVQQQPYHHQSPEKRYSRDHHHSPPRRPAHEDSSYYPQPPSRHHPHRSRSPPPSSGYGPPPPVNESYHSRSNSGSSSAHGYHHLPNVTNAYAHDDRGDRSIRGERGPMRMSYDDRPRGPAPDYPRHHDSSGGPQYPRHPYDDHHQQQPGPGGLKHGSGMYHDDQDYRRRPSSSYDDRNRGSYHSSDSGTRDHRPRPPTTSEAHPYYPNPDSISRHGSGYPPSDSRRDNDYYASHANNAGPSYYPTADTLSSTYPQHQPAGPRTTFDPRSRRR